LPYGTGVLYSTPVDDDDDRNPRLLTRESGRQPSTGGQESVFVQYAAYEAFPEATRVFSSWTAGPGQACFGGDVKQRADVVLTVPEEDGVTRLMVANYHGSAWHFDGACRPDCPRARPVRKRRAFVRPQYWPGSGGTIDATTVVDTRDDAAEDAFKSRLAEALTQSARQAGLPWRITYHAVTECQLFHDFDAFDPRSALGSTAPLRSGGPNPGGVRGLLQQHHGDTAIVTTVPPWLKTHITQEALVERLLAEPDNAQGGPVGGFLLLRGGRQTDRPDDPVGNDMGYCMQRVGTDRDEVGPFTRWQAGSLGADPDEVLDRHCQAERTVTRKSFPDSGELVGVDLFRWLVRERGLVDYRVAHYVYYRQARWLTDFLEQLIQKRHNLRRGGKTGGVALAEALLKLALNAIYGQGCMEATHFPTSTVMTMDRLNHSKLLDEGRVTHLTLLGGFRHQPVAGDQPPRAELLYAVTQSAAQARIRNVVQMSASILSDSRVVFLGYLSRLAELLDPRLAEKMYCGKKSFRFLSTQQT